MQLGYTILYVEDVKRALDFYQRAFNFKTKFFDPEFGDFGELDTGTTSLAFCSRKLLKNMHKNPQPANANAPCFEIALTTPDVAAALAQALAAGATLIQDVEAMSWGQTIAYVADPDGFLVEICTPMGSV